MVIVMAKGILEVVVDSVESAVHAEIGGADRYELCGDLIVGGTTPSLALYERIREKTHLPIHALLRPRFGDFLYSEEELNVLLRQVSMFHEAGTDAIVTGCLTKDGCIDMVAMEKVMEHAKGTKVCLHRAFDMCRDQEEALEAAEKLGIDTILTSGGFKSASEGMEVLDRLKKKAKKVDIMAGAGVTAESIRMLKKSTCLTTFHLSGKENIQSEMVYRNPRVNMGLEGLSEYEIIRTNIEKIKEARVAVDS